MRRIFHFYTYKSLPNEDDSQPVFGAYQTRDDINAILLNHPSLGMLREWSENLPSKFNIIIVGEMNPFLLKG